MLRLFLSGIVVSAFLVEGRPVTENAVTTNASLIVVGNIDPMIVGQTISREHQQLWKLQSEKYHDCGLCGQEPQAYPGE